MLSQVIAKNIGGVFETQRSLDLKLLASPLSKII